MELKFSYWKVSIWGVRKFWIMDRISNVNMNETWTQQKDGVETMGEKKMEWIEADDTE